MADSRLPGQYASLSSEAPTGDTVRIILHAGEALGSFGHTRVFAKGYGVRSLATGRPVDEHTLFGIASNTKAFTTMAIGLLAEEGKLGWDDRVVDYIL